jgi:hypothetical protein
MLFPNLQISIIFELIMKKHNRPMMKKQILFISLIVTLIAGAFIFLSSSNAESTQQQRPKVMSMTANVDIPEKMMFAGETYIFDRYDKHERLDRELNSFTYFHSTTLLLIKNANRFFPIIEPILKKHGIPDDIKYLAVIESSMNPRAVSPARAAGLWQFMPATGKQFGLEVSNEVDERFHIEKSTVAACKYLKDAYKKYNSWSAAAMAYNGGQGRITSELRDQQATDALDLWLVEETTRYFYRMLAIKLVFENPPQYGFVIKPHQLYKPMVFKEVKVTNSIPNLATFAKQQGVTYAQLKDFNSWLRDRSLTVRSGNSYTLKIPTRESLYYKKSDPVKVHSNHWVTQ